MQILVDIHTTELKCQRWS